MMASDVEGTTPEFKPLDVMQLGEGYSLHMEPARTYDWYSAAVYFCDPADGKLVRIAYQTVKKNQRRTVRWAKRHKRIHEAARREAGI
jgi:hypothetical protein